MSGETTVQIAPVSTGDSLLAHCGHEPDRLWWRRKQIRCNYDNTAAQQHNELYRYFDRDGLGQRLHYGFNNLYAYGELTVVTPYRDSQVSIETWEFVTRGEAMSMGTRTGPQASE